MRSTTNTGVLSSLTRGPVLIRAACAASLLTLVPACNCDDGLERTECDFVVTPAGENTVDFGEVEVGREAARSVRIENIGTVRLNAFNFDFADRNNTHYRTEVVDDFTVEIDGSETFTVVFRPLAESTNLGSSFTVTHPEAGGDTCPSFVVTLDGASFERIQLPDGGPGGDGGPDGPDGGDGDADGGPGGDGGTLLDAGSVVAPDAGIEISPTTEWSARGAFQQARADFATVVLDDNSILAIGGYSEFGGALTSIERFDPATGISRIVGEMNVPRAEAGAALLPSGRVAIVGGITEPVGGLLVTTLELFDPDTGEVFCAPGQGDCLIDDIDQGNGLFPLGRLKPIVRALVADPNANPPPDRLAVLFGTTVVLDALMPVVGGHIVDLAGANPVLTSLSGGDDVLPRTGETRIPLENGAMLIVGGTGSNGQVLADALRLDNTTEALSDLGLALAPRTYGMGAYRTIGDAVVLAGGLDAAGDDQVLVEEIADLSTAPVVAVQANVSVSPRVSGSMVRLDGDVLLLAGGVIGDVSDLDAAASIVPESSAELLVPFLSGYLRTAPDNGLATPRYGNGAVVADDDDQVAYFLGGFHSVPRRVAHPAIERFALLDNTFYAYGLMGPQSALVAMANSGEGALLSVGGIDPHTGAVSARARAYDAETHAYEDLPPLFEARAAFTITRLADNAAYLIAGGRDATGQVVNSASIYVPLNEAGFDVALPATLNRARTGHVATALGDGRVLLCGGVGSGGEALDTCEVFNPPSGLQNPETYDEATFALTEGRLSAGRVGHTQTLLESGSVVIIGGGDVEQDLVPADLFDPDMDRVDETGMPEFARRGHVAVGFGSNRVLIAGGEIYAGGLAPTASAEVFEGINGIFITVPEMDIARVGASGLLLADGSVLVSGGGDTGLSEAFPTRALRVSEVYVPGPTGIGAFVDVDLPLTYGRANIAAVDIFGRGVAASGNHRDGLLSTGAERRTPLFFVDRLLDVAAE